MEVTPLGAAGGEVTGSCYLVTTSRARLMLDCGMFQGNSHAAERNAAPLPTNLTAVALTHAHLDHTGRLPLLTKAGFRGTIFATPATIEMTGLILRDAARIQTQDAERQNRKHERAGEAPVVPLYTVSDVEETLRLLRPVPYGQPVSVAPGIDATFLEAGHMLGSAGIQLAIEDQGVRRKIVFSGDLGPRSAPILREFERFAEANLVFLESTYGDRDHQTIEKTVNEFYGIVDDAVARGGKILVPTFAVGRAQLLTTLLAAAFREKRFRRFPVYLDSPMAIEASQIYSRHGELFDEDMVRFLRTGQLAHDLSSLHMTASPDESRAINATPGPCMILAGSGMCTAGRILHHLRHNLWSPQTHVVIVGYQAPGSLGRQLIDGASRVHIFGEPVAVRAKVHTLGGFSAHAGQTDLLTWFSTLAPGRPRVALTHGEDGPRGALADKIAQQHGLRPLLPALGEAIAV